MHDGGSGLSEDLLISSTVCSDIIVIIVIIVIAIIVIIVIAIIVIIVIACFYLLGILGCSY